MVVVKAQRHWILVVEDDKAIKSIFQEELAKEGFKVLTSSDIQDAMRRLSNQKFDCIVLDMHLERGAGDQIVSHIRRDKRGFNFSTPVIVVSGELNPDLIKKIKDSVNGFFVKPFDLGAVIDKIKKLTGVK